MDSVSNIFKEYHTILPGLESLPFTVISNFVEPRKTIEWVGFKALFL